jgi:hypothetical protein
MTVTQCTPTDVTRIYCQLHVRGLSELKPTLHLTHLRHGTSKKPFIVFHLKPLTRTAMHCWDGYCYNDRMNVPQKVLDTRFSFRLRAQTFSRTPNRTCRSHGLVCRI